MPDYSKGKVYKLLNYIDNEVYVGSTIETLSSRMSKHRHETKRTSTQNIHQHMSNVGCEHFYIELIELYPCSCVEELRAREGHWIRQIGTLNACIAGRKPKDYYNDNYEKIKDYHKQYYKANPETIKEYKEKNKDRIQNYMKIYNKHYSETHQEEQKEYQTEYQLCHKERQK